MSLLLALQGGGGAYTLTAESGAVPIAGAANLASNRKLIADTANVAIGGNAATTALNRRLTADSGAVSVAGSNAGLVYTPSSPIDVKVSWLAFDTSATPVDVKVSWLAFDTAGKASGFSNEVEIKRWYIKRNKQILVFNSAQEADDYLESLEQAEKAIEAAQKTSRRARQRLRNKLVKAPIQTVDIDLLADAVSRFDLPALPSLIQQQDFERFMQIFAIAQAMQDEEDIELLLLA